MDSLIVGLLITVLVSQVVILAVLGGVAYLCYRTLIRPEAPCFAGMAPMIGPKIGTVEVDPTHPMYGPLSKMLAKKNGGGDNDPKAAKDEHGHYL